MRMRNRFEHKKSVLLLCLSLSVGHGVYAASPTIADYPMAMSNMVSPNVLVVYDDSQSMDAYMGGTLVSGNDPLTRGNIGRGVMRTTITNYRNVFNWGLMSYEMSSAPALRSTYAYYLGSDAGMVFTDDCVGYVAGTPPTVGVSATNGNRKCIANPQPFVGGNYVTYDASGDDSNILDVLYAGSGYTTLWGITPGAGTSYKMYTSHNTVNAWGVADFTGGLGTWGFTATDAGYLAQNPPITRQLYVPRGWGYISNVSGRGKLYEAVKVDSAGAPDATHYNNLLTLLGNETNGATGEIKNGAVFTTLKGTLDTAKIYFAGSLSGTTTPVTAACQQNFVMLVTDGLPTGNTSGNLYSAADRTNTCAWSTATNTCTTGSFGVAATDAITSTDALRKTTVSGMTSTKKDGTGAVTGNYDVQTYVVALGDTVANATAMSVMDAMAYNGGTEKAMAANDATAMSTAIANIANDITGKTSSGAAVAVANAHITSADNASYSSTYDSATWTGDLNSFAIDPVTKVTSSTSLWTAGTAQTQLNLRTSANRYIVTSIDTAGSIGGVQFQPTSATTTTKLSVAQQTLLNTPTYTDGAAVLAYLRGDRTNETAAVAPPLPYRTRFKLLGDIVNGEPVLLRAPSANYADTGYSAFKTAQAARTRTLFQGANDGMLHAFVAATGAESWAYIPNLVMADLNNLSRKPGFTHKYYVDGTPVVADVDFKQVDGVSGSGTDWRTILVGGLGKGGRGYYALDVTNPIASSEADAKSKVLWEFPNSITNATARNKAKLNMGYSYGAPIVAKTKDGDNWVVLLTSGYNNGTNSGDSGGDGLGHLYVVNPKTGDLIKDIETTGCHATPLTAPCGLAQIAGFATNADVDRTVEYVYGGDLYGNLWRFDFTSNSSSGWSVAKMATLKDSSGTVQPITTAPELTLVKIGGVDTRMVFVGTGQYLGIPDVSTTQTQTMYGIKDSLSAIADPLRNSLVQQTVTASGSTSTITSNAVDYTLKKGWYFDLPTSGERSVTTPALGLSELVFTTIIPSSTLCSPGGSSWFYDVDILTGGPVPGTTGTPGKFLGQGLASRPVFVQSVDGKVSAIIRIDGETLQGKDLQGKPAGTTGKRISWREIFN